MKYINGTFKILYIRKNELYFPVACLTENSFNEMADVIGTTTRDNPDGWASSRPTGQSYSISFSGLETVNFIQADAITYQDLKLFKRGRELVAWKIDDGNGNPEFGSGYIDSLGDTATIDEMVTFDASIIGFGAPGSTFENIYIGYKDRVETGGGILSSEICTQLYIENLLNS